MSQAEELLNSLSETIPEHIHPVVDSDSYFLIDPATRKIENMSRKDLILMQRDHNSERYTFQLPRYIEGHDMSLCNRVKCHFNNIEYDEETSTYIEHPDLVELTDLRVNPEEETSVICSWLITRQSTWYQGTLGFFLQYLCVDGEGNETYEWHTDEFTAVTVKKTRHNDEAAILEYTAIFEQWRERIFGAGDSVKSELIALTEEKLSAIKTEGTKQVESVNAIGAAQVEAIANEGLRVLNTIPEDYTAVSEQTAMLTKLAGPVIRQEAEGEMVAVKDSAKMPLLGLQMFGKSSQKTTNGHNLSSINDVTFTQMYRHVLDKPISAGTYYVSLNAVSDDTDSDICVLNFCDIDNAIIAGITVTRNTSFKQKVVVPSEATVLNLYASYSYVNSENDTATFSNIMIAIEEDAAYEPYTGGQPSPNPEHPQEIESVDDSTLSVGGKNLFSVSKCDLITVGASGVKRYGFEWDIPGTYTFSCHADTDVTAVAYKIYENGVYGPFTSVTEDVEFTVTLTEGQRLIVYKGPENEHFTYGLTNIQLEYGSVATEYESYVSEQTILSSINLPGIPVPSGGNYTDENGQQYIANYRDLERGVDVKQIEETVLIGTEYYEDFISNYDTITLAIAHKENSKIYCTHATQGREIDWANSSRMKFNASYFGVTNVDEFKTLVAEAYENGNPIRLLYCIYKPIETPIPEEELQAYRALHTNYPNTTILNDSGAYMKLAYATDTKMYIDNKFEELKNAIVNNS